MAVTKGWSDGKVAGQSGTAVKHVQASWHEAHHSYWPSIIALGQHPTSHRVCFDRP